MGTMNCAEASMPTTPHPVFVATAGADVSHGPLVSVSTDKEGGN